MAGRSAEIVPLLAAGGHGIDVYVDGTRVRTESTPLVAPDVGSCRVIDANEFLWRHDRGHYDVAVYQVGNSHLHRYIWPYMFRYPGLVVLHDARVHHARAQALLSSGRMAEYRAEFCWSHPGVPREAANLGILGVEGPFYYLWPMLRAVIATARVVGAHSVGVARALERDYPGTSVEHIALGEGRGDLDLAGTRAAFRAGHQIADDTVLFGVFGGLTAEKLVPEIIEAFRYTRAWSPNARLLLAGAPDPLIGLDELIRAAGITDDVIRLPALSDDDFDRAIAATDVVMNLRWPSARETSGPWVRSLALARPTVIVDLPHQSHVPSLDPRTWGRHAPSEDLSAGADARAVTVALDPRDLNHSLRTAMRRLSTDAALRERLGRQARSWWEREHTVERMRRDYVRAIERTAATPPPAPAPDWPAHIVTRPRASVDALLDPAIGGDESVATRLSLFDS